MLDFFRRQQSKLKWVWIVLIFIFSASLVLLYIPFDDLGSVSITNDVASVGRQTITAKEFQTAYRNYLNSIQGQVSPEMIKAFRFDRQIVDSLVTRRVMMEEARHLGLTVSAAEIEQKILENPVFREGGNFIGLERYQSLLQQNGLTVADFEASVRDEILQQKLRSFLTAGVSVSDAEVEDEYRRRNEKAKLDYFVIDPAMLESQVSTTAQDQRDYYEKNKTKYNVPEKRQAKYILLDTVKMRARLTASDDALQQYYTEHAAEYRIDDKVSAQHILFKTQGKTPQETEEIRQTARGVLQLAKGGADFAKLAKEFSQDASAANGGDLGTFGPGQMVPEFEKVAFTLAPGAISDLVQTEFGFHIIKVNERTPGRSRPFEEVKEAIRPIVLQRQAERDAADQIQKIAVELASNKDLNAVAQKYGAEVKDTPLVENGGSIPELGNASELLRQMFTLAKGSIGNAVMVDRGQTIPMLTEIIEAHPATFEEAQAQVMTDVRSEKARQLATDKANQVQEALKAGKDLQTAAKAVGAQVKTSDLLTRGATLPEFGLISDLDKEMFTLPLGKPGTPTTLAGKTLSFAVKERQEIKPEEMKAAIEPLRAEILPNKLDQYFGAYIQEAKKRMEDAGDIEINESVLAQLTATVS
jgi:peptidyl-prolyl cis-trans isomerase D